MRISAKDVTVTRVVEAVQRRVKSISHTKEWYFSSLGKANSERIKEFRNLHSGQRCFIIANGPSLLKLDLTFLKNEITFGMNRLYLIFDKMGFVPTYYSVVNELVIEQFADDLGKLPTTKFLNWNQRASFTEPDERLNFLRINMDLQDKFSHDLTQGVYSGGTVTYATLQLAFYMGFKEVYLIGLDHNFVDKGRPNTTEVRKTDEDKNHFHPDYFPKGMKWQLPDLYRSELAYAIARQNFEAQGRRVLDATVGGKCEVFEKVDYNQLF